MNAGRFLILASLCLSGCGGAAGKLSIAQGELFYSRQEFARSSGSFVQAREDETARPYAQYALGAVYLALDDGEAALEHLDFAENAAAGGKEHRELRYRIHYNSGIVRFQRGDYQGAADDFRRALQTEPARREAKHNLELSILSASRQNEQADIRSTRPGSILENKNERRSGVILDFMRQRETNRWKSFEWGSDDDSSIPDY